MLSIPFSEASVFGNWFPISRNPAAPSNASQMACISTSASECPTADFCEGIFTPPRVKNSPASSWCTSNPNPMRKFIEANIKILGQVMEIKKACRSLFIGWLRQTQPPSGPVPELIEGTFVNVL